MTAEQSSYAGLGLKQQILKYAKKHDTITTLGL